MRWLPALALFANLAACVDYNYYIQARVTIDPSVAPAIATRMYLMMNDDMRYPVGASPSTWPQPFTVTAFEARESPDGYGVVWYQPGTLSYECWNVEVSGFTPSELWLGAYLDVANTFTLGTGQPYGVVPDLPLTGDVVRRAGPDHALVVDIAISSLYQ
jgi:hypothetical protein